MIDLEKIAINLHESLRSSQIKYEDAIKEYGKACDYYSEIITEYRKKRGEFTIENKKNYPATLVQDIVKGLTAELKGKSEKARLYVKMWEHWIKAYENRINSAKFIGNKIKKITGEE